MPAREEGPDDGQGSEIVPALKPIAVLEDAVRWHRAQRPQLMMLPVDDEGGEASEAIQVGGPRVSDLLPGRALGHEGRAQQLEEPGCGGVQERGQRVFVAIPVAGAQEPIDAGRHLRCALLLAGWARGEVAGCVNLCESSILGGSR